jgi:hypothetical protein
MIAHLLSIIILSIIWIESFYKIGQESNKYTKEYQVAFIRNIIVKTFLFGFCIVIIVFILELPEYLEEFQEIVLSILINMGHKSLCYAFMIECIDILTKH